MDTQVNGSERHNGAVTSIPEGKTPLHKSPLIQQEHPYSPWPVPDATEKPQTDPAVKKAIRQAIYTSFSRAGEGEPATLSAAQKSNY